MKAKTKTTKTKAKTTKRKASASAKAFGKKAKRANDLAFIKCYLDGKSGRKIKTPSIDHKEASKRVWK